MLLYLLNLAFTTGVTVENSRPRTTAPLRGLLDLRADTQANVGASTARDALSFAADARSGAVGRAQSSQAPGAMEPCDYKGHCFNDIPGYNGQVS